ncbi:Eukaryotic peptide chain release factor GTP-binding subunit [Pichia kudriavzevii]|uniref:Eukaryotic peptide chain release factor GTP-binding subunit n=1 Tax=Pichia kudriavzevii TaxID=4909 RepID=A0A1V2LPP0_PICKU|nr:Eukaryotic peptide chain release factor GTP-binding subunit [Pichia kudriavzevii]
MSEQKDQTPQNGQFDQNNLAQGMQNMNLNAEKLNAAPKKKVLKLNLKSSTVKIPSKPNSEEPKTEKVKEDTIEKEKVQEDLQAKKTEETKKNKESKAEEPKKVEPTKKAETMKKSDSVAKASAKEVEDQIDPAIVNDMFGGKEHMSIIFMGHVDAGKSTMGGNLLYLTGAVDKRTVEKYEREAKDAGRQGWYLSWIMDTNKEERNDGKTIEVGKSYFETDKRRYTILDAPGHKLYVSEMIGGASQADVGVLVISARKGEYEAGFERGGQSREHAILAKTQGVNKIVVVINKMDDPTVGWSEERYNECISKLSLFLRGVGYAKEDITFMPVSGFTGEGLKERIPKEHAPWYNGPSLLEFLDNMPLAQRKINDPFMLPVSGKMKDLGTVIEGKIESGHIKKGQSLLLMPNRTNVEVLTIYNETEAEADSAFCGEQVRLRLKNVEEEDVSVGYVLTSTLHPVHTVTKFEAQVAIVELKSILSSGFSCVMHVHTAIEEVTFTQLLHKLEKGTNRKSKKAPAFAKQGMKIIAILETTEPVCLETYDDYQQLGRFTLRDQGQTIAIGKVTKLLE